MAAAVAKKSITGHHGHMIEADPPLIRYIVHLSETRALNNTSFVIKELDARHIFIMVNAPLDLLQAAVDRWHDENSYSEEGVTVLATQIDDE